MAKNSPDSMTLLELVDAIQENLADVKSKITTGKYKKLKADKSDPLFNAMQASFFKVGETQDMVARLRKKIKACE